MSISLCELPCSEKDKGEDELFLSLITTDTDGCLTVRAEATTADTSTCQQFSCDDAMMSWQEVFRKLLFIDGEGCIALRIATVTAI